MEEINKLVGRICFIHNYLQANGRDPLLEESLSELAEKLVYTHGGFLNRKLFEVYDEYFEDDQMLDLLSYVLGDVRVYDDELGGGEMLVGIKSSPLRIEAQSEDGFERRVIWSTC